MLSSYNPIGLNIEDWMSLMPAMLLAMISHSRCIMTSTGAILSMSAQPLRSRSSGTDVARQTIHPANVLRMAVLEATLLGPKNATSAAIRASPVTTFQVVTTALVALTVTVAKADRVPFANPLATIAVATVTRAATAPKAKNATIVGGKYELVN